MLSWPPGCEAAPDSSYLRAVGWTGRSWHVILPTFRASAYCSQPSVSVLQFAGGARMCSFYGCCDSGIHSERNTPNLRSGPDRSRHNRDLIFEGSRQTTVSEPREVTRLSARPEQHRHHHRSDRHEPRSDRQEHRHEPRSDPHHDQRHDQHRRDNTLNARSDNSMNSRASDPNLKNVHVVISGKVQGVYYRKWTVESATKLALHGWVRNCKDGTVEAVFSGKPDAVDHMLDKCRSGPSRARVASVEVTAAAGPPKKGFEQLDDKRW